jgi:hypothetical protein
LRSIEIAWFLGMTHLEIPNLPCGTQFAVANDIRQAIPPPCIAKKMFHYAQHDRQKEVRSPVSPPTGRQATQLRPKSGKLI